MGRERENSLTKSVVEEVRPKNVTCSMANLFHNFKSYKMHLQKRQGSNQKGGEILSNLTKA